ncbi:MAG: metallophosphoesterase [Spirochaetes bacterium]|nr:metallophosphoesterase [Spirochaetota bacterium]
MDDRTPTAEPLAMMARGASSARSVRAALLALAVLAALLALGGEAWAQEPGGGQTGKGKPGPSREAPFPAEVQPFQRLSAMLGRPTDTSVTINLLGNRDQDVFVEYGAAGGAYDRKTGTTRLAAGTGAEITITGLAQDREYGYRLQSRAPGETAFTPGPTGRMRTRRAAGSTFFFEIIGDSHPERPQQFDSALYVRNLGRAAADAPDFFMTIGDDFSVDTLDAVMKEAVDAVYVRQRLYLSLVGSVAPVFLVNGNHEQASLANLDGTAANVAVWVQNARNALFPQPAPDGFYSGDAEKVEHVGFLRDYYAWTWGDALFVVIDPYWHSKEPVDNVFGGGEKTRDLWNVTLGRAQYDWFRKTLEGSKATFKFVFAHHVSGTGRGGIERAPYYEWGGKSPDGRDGFAARRPGWKAPIHELMAERGVTAFVQGHDHVFANQLLDGVAYITLPEPADPSYALYNADAFRSGDILPNSGRVRLTVSPSKVVVEYLREWLDGDGPADGTASGPAYRFEIPAGGPPAAGVVDPAQSAPGTTVAQAGKERTDGTTQQRKKDPGAVSAVPKDRAAPKGTEASKGKGSPDAGAAPPPTGGAAVTIAASGDLHARTLVEYPGKTGAGLATAFTKAVDYRYRWGEDPAKLDRTTLTRSAKAGTVTRDAITGLQAGRTYHFRLEWAEAGSKNFALGEPGRFSTMKAAGSSYTFLVEADPHFDENSSEPVYSATLARMAADRPDFAMDLGDTSMVEKLATDAASYLARNQLVRSYWDDVGASLPFFMVLGNHDGEHGWPARKGQPESAEAAALRRTWLVDPNAAPADSFSILSDMAYAFEWGDALFVVLDPYAAETVKPGDDSWAWTLGKKQYDWLAGVLSASKAAYRFVFIHNILGGSGKDARGGADWAGLYEWGGSDGNGADLFAAKRPGWAMPLHALFVKYGVDVVFRGHDHFYAREEKDGVVYQLVPQPSLGNTQRITPEGLAEYGYSSGTFLPSPGYLRVSVAPGKATVEFVRGADGAVVHSYGLKP